ncbi:MAG: iron-only hydrogenase system regulator [Kiritimatiellae bacterium]|nr:iron-only hydrogenase system regulator [Kiritimatiellia bacterium]MDD4024473.1 iron-only hydrogenase system regulator [Kiritimatiellia bacterium]MDD4622463.1 iron-only hydrogenase system regulator [Kiritimatiellia bacterium]
MERRIGFVGIILEDRDSVEAVNHIISGHSGLILARVGLPCREKHIAVITLVVEASTDELGKFTGQLGRVEGVSVKSGLAKQARAGMSAESV